MEKSVVKFDNDFIQYTEKKKKSEDQFSAFSLAMQITLYILLIFFAIFFIWYTTFISTHKYYVVTGASMKDSLNSSLALDDDSRSEDAVYVNTVEKVKTFDVVVATRQVYNAEKKKYQKKDVVKRVMALEGDYISIAYHDDGHGNQALYFYRIPKGVNLSQFNDESARLDESTGKMGYTIYSYEEWMDRKSLSTFIGDEQTSAERFNKVKYENDFFGTFLDGHLEEISQLEYGKSNENFFVSSAGIVYVKVPKGKFFCMGDNRGHSSDSRDNGFYDMKQIVGRVEIVIYNYNFGKRLLKVVDYYFAQVEKFFAR